jgi:uncharacterized damage-inducible protein DinB
MPELFTLLARYNGWANERLYGCARFLPEDDYFADRGAFFGSLHGTLNHVLVGDRIWMRRFTGHGPTFSTLDSRPFSDLASLWAARKREDARILAWVSGLDETALDREFTFRSLVDPTDVSEKLSVALLHFFNHQTHHRGQAHALLTQTGRDVPSLDLLMFQRGG